MGAGIWGALAGIGKGVADVGRKAYADELERERQARVQENVLARMEYQSALNRANTAFAQGLKDESWKRQHAITRKEQLQDAAAKRAQAIRMFQLKASVPKAGEVVLRNGARWKVEDLRKAWEADNTTVDEFGTKVPKQDGESFEAYYNRMVHPKYRMGALPGDGGGGQGGDGGSWITRRDVLLIRSAEPDLTYEQFLETARKRKMPVPSDPQAIEAGRALWGQVQPKAGAGAKPAPAGDSGQAPTGALDAAAREYLPPEDPAAAGEAEFNQRKAVRNRMKQAQQQKAQLFAQADDVIEKLKKLPYKEARQLYLENRELLKQATDAAVFENYERRAYELLLFRAGKEKKKARKRLEKEGR